MRRENKLAIVELALILLSLLLTANIEETTQLNSPTLNNETNLGTSVARRVIKLRLITGDVVYVILSLNGLRLLKVEVADPHKSRAFKVLRIRNSLYVIPSDVNLNLLDIEFFNINYLIKNGYYNQSYIPIIVKAKTRSQLLTITNEMLTLLEGKVKVKVLSKDPPLSSIKVLVNFTKDFYERVLTKLDLERVWLDRKCYVVLDHSVPLIRAPEVWALGYNGSGVVIAILDTGIDYNHPDFYFPNGTSKVIAMESFVEYPEDEVGDPYDYNGHGTHCASIATGTGATSNGIYKGVAPGATLIVGKVLNREGWGYSSWIIEGIEWAVSQGAHVISMSIGGGPTDGTDPLSMKCNWAVDQGVVVVVAAGNLGDYWEIETPGAAEKVITVGASNDNDEIAYFSSCGPTLGYLLKPEVVAPGVSITAAYPGGGYETLSGTSMATPHVAGLVALILQRYNSLTPKEVKNIITSTAVFLPNYNVYRQGAGRVDAYNATNAKIIVDPAIISLGLQPIDKAVKYNITIKNISPQPLNITFNIDAYTVDGSIDGLALEGMFYVEQEFVTINPGSQSVVTLTVNLTSLPWVDYEGVIWISHNGVRLAHVVFSVFKYYKLTAIHYNRSGDLADTIELLLLKSGVTSDTLFRSAHVYNDSHICELYVSEGYYHVMSFYLPSSELYLHIIDTNVIDNMLIIINDTKLNPVAFNKPSGTILLEKYIVAGVPVYVDGDETWTQVLFMWWYPQSTADYLFTGYTTMLKYTYMNIEDSNPGCPSLISTSNIFMPWTTLPNVLEPTVLELELNVNVDLSYMTFASPPFSTGNGFWILWEPLQQDISFLLHFNSPTSLTVKTSSHSEAYLLTSYSYYSSLPGMRIEDFTYLLYTDISHPETTHRAFFAKEPEILMPAQLCVNIRGRAISAIEGYIVTTSSDSRDYCWFECVESQVINHTCKVFANNALIYEDISYSPYTHIQLYDAVEVPVNLLIIDELWRQHRLSTHVKYSLHYRMLSGLGLVDIYLKPSYGDIGIYVEGLNMNNTVVTCDNYHILLYIANEATLTNFKLYYDYGSGEQESNGTLIGKFDRFSVIKFTLPPSNSPTYVNLRINITEGGSLYYRSKSYEIYVERAYYFKPLKLALDYIPRVLMFNDIFNATFIVGDTSEHNHTDLRAKAATSDVLGAIRVASSFSEAARRAYVETYVDINVTKYENEVITIDWSLIPSPVLVIVGGPAVNYLTYYYNSSLSFFWRYIPNVKSVIYSNLTGKEYRSGRDEYGRLYDHAIIAALYDQKAKKYVLITWGISRYGTQAACYVLQKYEEYRDLLKGVAVIIKWTDLNMNGIVDKSDNVELIEKWPE